VGLGPRILFVCRSMNENRYRRVWWKTRAQLSDGHALSNRSRSHTFLLHQPLHQPFDALMAPPVLRFWPYWTAQLTKGRQITLAPQGLITHWHWHAFPHRLRLLALRSSLSRLGSHVP
jgi:hypothetical protein